MYSSTRTARIAGTLLAVCAIPVSAFSQDTANSRTPVQGKVTIEKAQAANSTLPAIRYGEIVAVQNSAKYPGQSYALFVPSTYDPDKRWPTVYVFDPGARGSIPLETMKSAAEQYGYILAGSNNSHNGPWKVQTEAAQAMWNDTHQWLTIDDHRIYFAGLSGGARAAALLAQRCNCAQGIFLNGAGYSTEAAPRRKDTFAVFAAVGYADFNYGEMVILDAALDGLGKPHFLRRFEGSHQWAPPEVWEEAFAWMELFAMKNHFRSADDSLVAREYSKAIKRAQDLEHAGPVHWALEDYRGVSSLFQGLTDTKVVNERSAALEKSEAVAEAKETEEREMDEQRRLAADVVQKAELVRNPNATVIIRGENLISMSELRSNAKSAVTQLRRRVEKEERPEKRRALERARSSVLAYLMETGQSALEQNDHRLAQTFFELAIEAQPDQWWPNVLLARSLAKADNTERAIETLAHARELGLSAQKLLDMSKTIPEFSSLSDDASFKKLITDESPGH